jgi:hypothetical protein
MVREKGANIGDPEAGKTHKEAATMMLENKRGYDIRVTIWQEGRECRCRVRSACTSLTGITVVHESVIRPHVAHSLKPCNIFSMPHTRLLISLH